MSKETRVKIKRGTCEICGHEGGIVPYTDLCGCCCFGEYAAQEEYDDLVDTAVTLREDD